MRPVEDVWILDLHDDGTPGDLHQITDSSFSNGHVSWSPDGSCLAALATEQIVAPGLPQLVVVDPESGKSQELARSLDRSCAPYPGARSPIWDGDRLWFGARGQRQCPPLPGRLGRFTRARAHGPGERVIGGYDLAGGTLAFVATSPTELPELFTVIDGTERRLTSLGAQFHRSHPALPPERFTVPSPGGGDIDAWIIRPADVDDGDGTRHPMLLSVHGGPMTQYANSWFDEFQLWASAGYVVVYANPHGSTGSTEEWLRAIRSPVAEQAPGTGWGGIDYEDLMAVVDAAVDRYPCIDPDRLGILGGSYGGYMASWMIGHTDRFAAACSERAVQQPLLLETSPTRPASSAWELGVSHLEAPDEYLRHSPITYVKDIAHAGADPALRERPALPDRAGRPAVHRAAHARAGGRVPPVPR